MGKPNDDGFEPDGFEPDPPPTATRHNGVLRMSIKATSPDTSDPEPVPKKEENPFSSDASSSSGALQRGVVQGGTMGFSDELAGVAAALSDKLGRSREADQVVRDAKAKGTYDPSAASPQEKADLQEEQEGPSFADDYRRNRDDFRGDLDAAKKSHPVLYGAGELAGTLAVPVPGGPAVKGLARVKQFAKTGAVLGAVGGLGHSRGDVGEMLADVGIGGVSGGVVGGALGVGNNIASALLGKMAERRAYKALDPYMKTLGPLMRKKLGREPTSDEVMAEVQKLGRRMLDDKIIPEGKVGRWANSETLARNAALARDEAGEMQGAFAAHLDDTGRAAPISMEAYAQAMEAEALEMAKDPSQLAVARNLMKEAQAMRQSGIVRALGGEDPTALSLTEAEKVKRGLQDAVYGIDAARRGGPMQEAKATAAALARKTNDDAIEAASGPEEREMYQALKNKYGELARIAQTGGYGAMRGFRNNVVSLGDQQLAQVGANIGKEPLEKGVTAALLALANKLARERGSAGMARTFNNLAGSNQLSAAPSALMDEVSPLAPYWNLLKDEETPK